MTSSRTCKVNTCHILVIQRSRTKSAKMKYWFVVVGVEGRKSQIRRDSFCCVCREGEVRGSCSLKKNKP